MVICILTRACVYRFKSSAVNYRCMHAYHTWYTSTLSVCVHNYPLYVGVCISAVCMCVLVCMCFTQMNISFLSMTSPKLN